LTETQKIIPFLWFNRDAADAVAFYISVFGGHEIRRLDYPEGVETPGGTPGALCTIDFEIKDMRLTALNGGLDGGGKGIACAWIHDRWGLRWQIVPKSLMDLYATGDSAAIARAFKLMLTMVKLDGPALAAAARDKAA